MKTLYCLSITKQALQLIRRFDGDVVGNEAIICNYLREEPGRDKKGNIVGEAYRIIFPNQQAICYTRSGEIAFLEASDT